MHPEKTRIIVQSGVSLLIAAAIALAVGGGWSSALAVGGVSYGITYFALRQTKNEY